MRHDERKRWQAAAIANERRLALDRGVGEAAEQLEPRARELNLLADLEIEHRGFGIDCGLRTEHAEGNAARNEGNLRGECDDAGLDRAAVIVSREPAVTHRAAPAVAPSIAQREGATPASPFVEFLFGPDDVERVRRNETRHETGLAEHPLPLGLNKDARLRRHGLGCRRSASQKDRAGRRDRKRGNGIASVSHESSAFRESLRVACQVKVGCGIARPGDRAYQRSSPRPPLASARPRAQSCCE